MAVVTKRQTRGLGRLQQLGLRVVGAGLLAATAESIDADWSQ
jgi:hypothetical protein